MMSLLATSAFGKKFKMSDPDFQILNDAVNLQNDSNNSFILMSMVPFLKYIFREKYQNMIHVTSTQREYAGKEYTKHLQTYTDGVIRDFTDAMIFAKIEAEAEDSNDSKYLKDKNVVKFTID